MLFNSIEFLIFFPVVTTAYFLLPHEARWVLLLAASALFYMAFVPAYVLILLFTITIDYAAGLLIERSTGARRKAYLVASLVSNVGILAFFKYADFLNQNITALAKLLDWNYSPQSLEILLPIGLSFHTFQAMSYTIEVYRGHQRAERHFGIYALYVMFYPQLVAGPIERPQNLLPQFREHHTFNPAQATAGHQRMLWGMFKKVVIADRLALVVNPLYAHPQDYDGMALLVATLVFSFQIYCDFSGYSDIAIGAAEAMGFRLMENFRSPYFASSIPEFWTRWHISLSTWFKDYVYLPLGGNRVRRARWCLNLMIVFLISGLWHGASWTFVVWGALHGVYVIGSRVTSRLRVFRRWPVAEHALGVATTFTLVSLAWIFFRAASMSDAGLILGKIFNDFRLWSPVFESESEALAACIALIAVLLVCEIVQRGRSLNGTLEAQPTWVRWAAYLGTSLAIMNIGVISDLPFIYFQF
jgi:D-alanyl-lipoteichoic acid acyltransferase DltB (MBOAT superfamily)